MKNSTLLLFTFLLIFTTAQGQNQGWEHGLTGGAVLSRADDVSPSNYLVDPLRVFSIPGDEKISAGFRIGYYLNKPLLDKVDLNLGANINYNRLKFHHSRLTTVAESGLNVRERNGMMRFAGLYLSLPLDIHFEVIEELYLLGGLNAGYLLYNRSRWEYRESRYRNPETGQPLPAIEEQFGEEPLEPPGDYIGWRAGFGIYYPNMGVRFEAVLNYEFQDHYTTPSFRRNHLSFVLKKSLRPVVKTDAQW